MDFQTAVRTCLAVKYVDFTGRAARSEYWWFALFTVIVQIVLHLLQFILGETLTGILSGLVALAFLLPSLAVSVRRLHDKDKSGWFLLLGFIPIIGGLILLFWFVTPGTPGANRFGADPLGGAVPVP